MTSTQKARTNLQLFCLVWQINGGVRALLKSGTFWLTFVLWVICAPVWTEPKWWEQPMSILPNLLGFTLGGFAIFLGFGSDSFKLLISDKDEKKAPYLSVSSAFLLFVFVQVFSLLYSLASYALWQPTPAWFPWPALIKTLTPFFWGIGYFGFLYSISLSLRAAIRIFRISRWYNSFLVSEEAKKIDESSPK